MEWTKEKVGTKVLEVLRQHAQQGVEVATSSHLVADLGIDSLGVMEVIADVEDAFGLSIPDETLREVDTVADVEKAISSRLELDGRLRG